MKRLLYLIRIIGVFITINAIAQLPENAENISPLLIGERVPEIELLNTGGRKENLAELFREKPTVLIFYRGGWCPYCTAHLGKIAEAEEEILKLGYQVIAISPDEPERLNTTINKKDLKYTLLSDGDGTLTQFMGIAYQAPDKKWKTNQLQKHSGGRNAGFLPVPSIFVVDKKGVIKFEYIAPDYTHRMEADLLIAVLKALK